MNGQLSIFDFLKKKIIRSKKRLSKESYLLEMKSEELFWASVE